MWELFGAEILANQREAAGLVKAGGIKNDRISNHGNDRADVCCVCTRARVRTLKHSLVSVPGRLG